MAYVPERVYHSVNVPYDYHSPLCLVFPTNLVNMPLWLPKVVGIRKVRPFQSLDMNIFPEIWPVCVECEPGVFQCISGRAHPPTSSILSICHLTSLTEHFRVPQLRTLTARRPDPTTKHEIDVCALFDGS